jgi:hypothetical protein
MLSVLKRKISASKKEESSWRDPRTFSYLVAAVASVLLLLVLAPVGQVGAATELLHAYGGSLADRAEVCMCVNAMDTYVWCVYIRMVCIHVCGTCVCLGERVCVCLYERAIGSTISLRIEWVMIGAYCGIVLLCVLCCVYVRQA